MDADLAKLRSLVAQDDLSAVVTALIESAQARAPRVRREVLLHASSLKELGSQNRMGLLSTDEARRERIRIRAALLELLDELEESAPARPAAPQLDSGSVPEVFISYAWADAGVADEVEAAFQQGGLKLTRDIHDAPYGADLPSFMQRLGRGDRVVLLVSDSYLKSRNCMYEALEFLRHGGFNERALPIVLPDAAAVYRASGSAAYVEYWDGRVNELNAMLKSLGSLENTHRIYEELNHCGRIRAAIDRFIDHVQRMNSLSLEEHRATGFRAVLAAVRGV